VFSHNIQRLDDDLTNESEHQGGCDIVRNLIAIGVPINTRNADGNNAPWLACVGGHQEVIDSLVGAGIDINNKNDNGATPLV
jgi:ankyrin repeat protein